MGYHKAANCRRAAGAAVAALALAGSVNAAPGRSAYRPVTLQVVDRDTGEALRVWRHDSRLFVAGRPGARYAVRLTNNTDARVMAVMSVDGVNVLTGETAGYDQEGYVFEPHEAYDVTGWRKSDAEVAVFRFAPLSQSYAARTGRPGEVGVIGVAVFREKIEAPAPSVSRGLRAPAPISPSRIAPPAPAALAPPSALPSPAARVGSQDAAAGPNAKAARSEKLGTAHGEREGSAVDTVDFDRATSYPQYVRQIEYDSYANLVRAGVIPRSAPTEGHPQPFPQAPAEPGYVPDPPEGR